MFGCGKPESDNQEEGHRVAIDWIPAEPESYPDNNDTAPDLIEFDEPELPLALTNIMDIPEVVIHLSDPILPRDNPFTLNTNELNMDETSRILIADHNYDELNNLEATSPWGSGGDCDAYDMPKTIALPMNIKADMKIDEVMQTTQGPDDYESSLDSDDSDCASHGYLIPEVVHRPVFPTNAVEYRETKNPTDQELSNDEDYDSDGSLIPTLVLAPMVPATAPQTEDHDQESNSDDDDDSLSSKLVTTFVYNTLDPETNHREPNDGGENESGSVIAQLLHFILSPASGDDQRDETGEPPSLGNDLNVHENNSTPAFLNFIPINVIDVQEQQSEDSGSGDDTENDEEYFTA